MAKIIKSGIKKIHFLFDRFLITTGMFKKFNDEESDWLKPDYDAGKNRF